MRNIYEKFTQPHKPSALSLNIALMEAGLKRARKIKAKLEQIARSARGQLPPYQQRYLGGLASFEKSFVPDPNISVGNPV